MLDWPPLRDNENLISSEGREKLQLVDLLLWWARHVPSEGREQLQLVDLPSKLIIWVPNRIVSIIWPEVLRPDDAKIDQPSAEKLAPYQQTSATDTSKWIQGQSHRLLMPDHRELTTMQPTDWTQDEIEPPTRELVEGTVSPPLARSNSSRLETKKHRLKKKGSVDQSFTDNKNASQGFWAKRHRSTKKGPLTNHLHITLQSSAQK